MFNLITLALTTLGEVEHNTVRIVLRIVVRIVVRIDHTHTTV